MAFKVMRRVSHFQGGWLPLRTTKRSSEKPQLLVVPGNSALLVESSVALGPIPGRVTGLRLLASPQQALVSRNPVFRALRRQVRIVGQRDCFRVADLHVSHLSSGGMGVPVTLGRACKSSSSRMLNAQRMPPGISVPALAETRHPFAVVHRSPREPSQKIEFAFLRQSLKQLVESLGSAIFLRSSLAERQDLAALRIFASSCSLRQYSRCRSPAFFSRCKLSCCRSTASRYAHHLPGYGVASPDSHFLSAFPGHRSRPAHGSVSEPAWQLRPALVGYACYAVSKAAYASPCRPSSVHLRRGRSS